MDDGEGINPREAAAGLGLLAATMAALVGLFVYRIVMERPLPPPSASVAPQLPAAGDVEPAPPVDPTPIGPLEPAKTDASTEIATPPDSEPMPRFVAPANRANQ